MTVTQNTPSTVALQTGGLSVARGGRTVVDNVDVAFHAGSVTVLLGENGAGKSTLLDALVGLVPATLGNPTFKDGASVLGSSTTARARRIASVDQQTINAPLLRADVRILQGLVPRRGIWSLMDDDVRPRVDAIARELDLVPLLARPLGTLSGGERRRVDVARGLIDDEAEVVLLDEPFAGIDVSRRGCVMRALRHRAENGAAVVVSVHEIDIAVQLGDAFVGLKSGRVVVDTTTLTAADLRAVFETDAILTAVEGGTSVFLSSTAAS